MSQQDSVTQSLEEIVITAQRIPERILSVPYAIKKISRNYLETYSPRTTPEALQGMNGVFIQKTNHGSGSAFIRGLTGNQTLILIDGIRLNNSTYRYGPNQYLNTIDPYIIEAVEVTKGTGSVQFGTDALGGIIHVFSQQPVFSTAKPSWNGKLISKFMTGGMEKTGRGQFSYSAQKIAISGGVTYRNFGDLLGGDTTGRQSPSGYKDGGYDLKAKFLLDKNVILTLSHQHVRQRHVPIYHKIRLENFMINEFSRQERSLQYVSVDIKGNVWWRKKIEIIGSRHKSIEGRRSRKNGSSTLRTEMDDVNTVGLTAGIFSTRNKIWSANTGVELYLDKIHSRRDEINIQDNETIKKRGLYPNNAKYLNYSLYSLHHLKYNKWVVDAGIRFNGFRINLRDSTLGRINIHPMALVYNAALLYTISTQQTIYINYSTGYRAPNIDDMGSLGIVDFRYEIPSGSLRPEKSINIELGYKFNADKWKGDIAIYAMELTDLITRIKIDGEIINGYQVYKKENIDEAIVKGMEAEISWNMTKQSVINASITYTYGKNKILAEPLRRIPPLHGRVMSTFRKNEWYVSGEVMMAARQNRLSQGDKEDNRIPIGGTPGWKVFNLFAGTQCGSFHINFGLQNLFNTDYRTHGSGINGVGRSAWLAVTFDW